MSGVFLVSFIWGLFYLFLLVLSFAHHPLNTYVLSGSNRGVFLNLAFCLFVVLVLMFFSM